jgi:hypothetical protein
MKCKKNYCQYHVPKTCCDTDSFKLMLREVNEDRKPLMALLFAVPHVID